MHALHRSPSVHFYQQMGVSTRPKPRGSRRARRSPTKVESTTGGATRLRRSAIHIVLRTTFLFLSDCSALLGAGRSSETTGDPSVTDPRRPAVRTPPCRSEAFAALPLGVAPRPLAGGFRDAGDGSTLGACEDSVVLVGEDPREAVRNVTAAVVAAWHWSLRGPVSRRLADATAFPVARSLSTQRGSNWIRNVPD